MFGNFTEEAQNILVMARREMLELKHPYIGTEHLILSILSINCDLTNRLEGYKLTYKRFKEEIIKIIGCGTKKSELFIYTPLLKKIISNSVLDSKENNEGNVTVEHLFSAFLELGEGIAIRTFIGMGIDIQKMYDEFSSTLIKKNKNSKNKKLLIDELGIDINEKAKRGELDPVIGREEEIKRLLEVLCRRTKNNPVLVGLAGVGKTAIVEELSRMIVGGMVPNNIKDKRIISLDMATMVAGTKYRGEFEERMKKVLKEIEENQDIIIFIDEIHTLVGAGGAEGAIDASNILKPSLARGKIRCIGATTHDEYKKFIEKDSALERRFQKIIIDPPSIDKTKDILIKLKPIYEAYHHVKINDTILNDIISLSEKYVYDRNQPDKSIDILDEVCSKVSINESTSRSTIEELKNKINNLSANKNSCLLENNITKALKYRKQEAKLISKLNELELFTKKNDVKEVTKKDVAHVINIKTKIPIYEILEDNKEVIKNIKEDLKNNILGQDNVLNELLNITKKIKLGYKKDNHIESLLFLGPSGVGKTCMAKVYAKNMVGDTNLIRLDMSEYSDITAINKIIGSSPGYIGYDDNKNILEEIRNKPHSVLLLDEIEKAHPKVIDLFYQVLDEGKIKDSKGNIIRFDNTIIIMTSNIGFEKNNVGFNNKNTNETINNLKEYFNISFINRISNILVFNTLTKEIIESIINNKINILKEKYHDTAITINKKVIEEIIELSNYEEFGARKIDQIISSKVENIIVDKLINNENIISIKTLKEYV